jgi:UDPglucose 6-dehydrogenase
MENPDLLLLGTDEHESKKIINKIYNKVYTKKNNKNFISNLNLYEAEIAKICVNSFVTIKISFSNFVSNIIQSGNKKGQAKNILSSMGKDTRIGLKYLSTGANFSGPCFPRDNIALSKYCAARNISNYLTIATDKENNVQQVRYLDLLKRVCKKNKIYKPKIGIIGLSYKSNSDVIEKSPGTLLINKLKKKYKISFYDPYFKKEIIEKNIYRDKSFEEHLKNNDVFFLCYKDKNFKITDKIQKRIENNKYIIDLWNFYNFDKIGNVKVFNIHKKLFI